MEEEVWRLEIESGVGITIYMGGGASWPMRGPPRDLANEQLYKALGQTD